MDEIACVAITFSAFHFKKVWSYGEGEEISYNILQFLLTYDIQYCWLWPRQQVTTIKLESDNLSIENFKNNHIKAIPSNSQNTRRLTEFKNSFFQSLQEQSSNTTQKYQHSQR